MSDPLEMFLNAVEASDDPGAERAAVTLSDASRDPLPALRRMLMGPEVNRRWWAVRALAALGTEGAVEPIIGALTDPDGDVRACAVVALAHLRPQAGIDPLVARLSDRSAYVGRLAADALSQFGPPAVEALVRALEEGDTPARAGAARALSVLGSPRAIPALCRALDDPSATVTHYARQALDRMGVGITLFRP